MLTVADVRARAQAFLDGLLSFADLQLWIEDASFGQSDEHPGEPEAALRDLQSIVDHAIAQRQTRADLEGRLRAFVAVRAAEPALALYALSLSWAVVQGTPYVNRREARPGGTGTAASPIQDLILALS